MYLVGLGEGREPSLVIRSIQLCCSSDGLGERHRRQSLQVSLSAIRKGTLASSPFSIDELSSVAHDANVDVLQGNMVGGREVDREVTKIEPLQALEG